MQETESANLVQKIAAYLKDFRKEIVSAINYLDKGAILYTDKKRYYIKFDSKYWILAGKETGKFVGAGFALNSKYYNFIFDRKLDILYTNRPNYVYYYSFDTYQRHSFNHIQSYNSERVRVISINEANDVWLV